MILPPWHPIERAPAGGTRKNNLIPSSSVIGSIMNHRLLIGLLSSTLLIAAIAVTPATGQGEARTTPVLAEEKLDALMQMKLNRSKEILEGLALEDFEKIAKSARALRLLSLESGWNVLQTEEYAEQSKDFRRNTALIAEAGEQKDLGRATMGYVALTVRCVECHSYMRKHRNNQK